MKNYFEGYYCRDDLHLQVINKDSNRKILNALREAYPSRSISRGIKRSY